MTVTSITLTQTYISPSPSSSAPQGEVEIELAGAMTDSATGTIYPAKAIIVAVVNGVLVPTAVEATDDATTVPAGLTYHFTERIAGGPVREWDAPVPHAAPGGTIALSALYASP